VIVARVTEDVKENSYSKASISALKMVTTRGLDFRDPPQKLYSNGSILKLYKKLVLSRKSE